jgi:hypothetical protein
LGLRGVLPIGVPQQPATQRSSPRGLSDRQASASLPASKRTWDGSEATISVPLCASNTPLPPRWQAQARQSRQ